MNNYMCISAEITVFKMTVLIISSDTQSLTVTQPLIQYLRYDYCLY